MKRKDASKLCHEVQIFLLKYEFDKLCNFSFVSFFLDWILLKDMVNFAHINILYEIALIE